jgi:hypothetical protein
VIWKGLGKEKYLENDGKVYDREKLRSCRKTSGSRSGLWRLRG